MPHIEDANFLDLCAGSGAVGIEAISRGAGHVTFVDGSPRMAQLTKGNLHLCGVEELQYQVVVSDATEFLRRQAKQKRNPWQLLYFDPPYADDYLPVLDVLARHPGELVAWNGLLIVEHYDKNHLPEVVDNLRRFRVLIQGDSALSFYSWAVESSPAKGDK